MTECADYLSYDAYVLAAVKFEFTQKQRLLHDALLAELYNASLDQRIVYPKQEHKKHLKLMPVYQCEYCWMNHDWDALKFQFHGHKKYIRLSNLYIPPAFRGLGIATKKLALLKSISDKWRTPIALWASSNTPGYEETLICWYMHNGFTRPDNSSLLIYGD